MSPDYEQDALDRAMAEKLVADPVLQEIIAREMAYFPIKFMQALYGGIAFRHQTIATTDGDVGCCVFYLPLDCYEDVLKYVKRKFGPADNEWKTVFDLGGQS